MCRCKRGWGSPPTDGSPDIGGMLIAEALSQALTARSERYAALVVLNCFWVRPGGDTSRGLNPTDVSAWDGALGGTPYTHFNLHTVT